MSDELDRRVLTLISEMIKFDFGDVDVVQTVWADRERLVRALVKIRDWDYEHSEALSLNRVSLILNEALTEVGEL